jgi:subtilase family serine protease
MKKFNSWKNKFRSKSSFITKVFSKTKSSEIRTINSKKISNSSNKNQSFSNKIFKKDTTLKSIRHMLCLSSKNCQDVKVKKDSNEKRKNISKPFKNIIKNLKPFSFNWSIGPVTSKTLKDIPISMETTHLYSSSSSLNSPLKTKN